MAEALRDTDADWRHIGATDPHWGVLTDPRFRRDVLDAEALDLFYASGRSDIGGFVAWITQATGAPPHGRALDFGCGVGRLAEAMVDHVDSVTGFDISPGMLERARARNGRVEYVDTLPEGPFDWINSYIVLQHIPPERGLGIIAQLADRLALNGVTSLHVTFAGAGEAPPLAAAKRARFFQTVRTSAAPSPPVGEIAMYDYDLGAVCDILWNSGMRRLSLQPVEHGIHRGFIIIGRREAAS